MLNSHDCDCYYIIAVHCRVCCGPRARPRAYQVLCAVAAAPIGLGCFDNCCCCDRRPPGVRWAAAREVAAAAMKIAARESWDYCRSAAVSASRKRCPPPTPRRRQKRWMYAHAEPKKGLTCVHGTFTQNQRSFKIMLVRITSWRFGHVCCEKQRAAEIFISKVLIRSMFSSEKMNDAQEWNYEACSVRATCTVTRETCKVDISNRIQKKNTFEVESQNRRTDSIIEEARSGLRKIVLLRVYKRINVATMWRRTIYTRNFLWLVTFRVQRKEGDLWSLWVAALRSFFAFTSEGARRDRKRTSRH